MINMVDHILKVVITGATSDISYSLLYMICKGQVFGPEQEVILHLIDDPSTMGVLRGVAMEVADCAFPLLIQLVTTEDLAVAFNDVSAAFLVGTTPREESMDSRDLLFANVKFYKGQAEALDRYAKKEVKIVVIGNSANTNALICSNYAPTIPKENFTAMTRLDQNRAQAQIASKLHVPISAVRNVIIWGNHSSTLFPDATHAVVEIDGNDVAVPEAIKDVHWLKTNFLEIIRRREFIVNHMSNSTAAMSVAKAASDHMKNWFFGTSVGEIVSMGVISDGSYEITEDIVFSFPVTIKEGKWDIVQNLPIDDFARKMLDITMQELIDERAKAVR